MAMHAHSYADPSSPDWQLQQESLNHWWEENSKSFGLPEAKPRLIRLQTSYNTSADGRRILQKWKTQAEPFMQVAETVGSYLEPPPRLHLTAFLWDSLPRSIRHKPAKMATEAMGQLAQVLRARGLILDEFQEKCVQKMQADESIHARPLTRPNEGYYRYVLAVRHDDAGTVHQPLAGIIDIELTPENDQYLMTDDAIILARIVIITAGVLAGFLAMIVFYLISQRLILAPVRELKTLTERIAGGDTSARANLTTGDEFEELSDSFNDMLSELERARNELETINRSLDTRLGELAETNVALFESNRLKSEFLANVSHELRTPLTSIIGFADLMQDSLQNDPPPDPGRITRYANNILNSGRMLLDIINDLLDLAKIEAGKIELHRSSFSLRDMCEAMNDFVKPMIDKNQLNMEMELDDDLPTMKSDAGKIRQILFNLLSNAIKYTPEGGIIRLEVHGIKNNNKVRIVVSDNGPGIAPEHQESIFEKFHQLDSSVTRAHSGTGLGLPISRDLCQMLGGSIRLESELNKGSSFIVELPVVCPEKAHRPLPTLT
jgi:signal transduction histidine kinase